VGCVWFGARNVGDGRGVLTVLLVGGQLNEDAQEIGSSPYSANRRMQCNRGSLASVFVVDR
jgi:hypothetical protein